jgi:transposase
MNRSPRRQHEEHSLDVLERLIHGALHVFRERVARPLEAREVGEHELVSLAVRDTEDAPQRRLRLVRDDRHLAAAERVHQRRLADVGAAGDRHESRLHSWLKRRRETGKVDPKPIPGPPATKGAMLQEWLAGHLQRNPDLTLEEHCEAFEEERRVKVSTATMSRSISRLPGGGWPPKKSPR